MADVGETLGRVGLHPLVAPQWFCLKPPFIQSIDMQKVDLAEGPWRSAPMPDHAPAQSDRIRVLVADAHPLILRGLSAAVGDDAGLELVGEAADGRSVVRLNGSLRPDVIVLPLRAAGIDGIDVVRQVCNSDHRAKIIAIVEPGRPIQAQLALRAGAAACVYPCINNPDFACLIRRVLDGESGHGSARWGRVSHDIPTLREVDVLRRVGYGRSNGEIARDLGITIETVKAHLRTLYTRLGARDRTHAAVLGYQLGLIPRRR